MNPDVVAMVCGIFHAAASRALPDPTITVWERALADLPDVTGRDGAHLAETVALDLIRDSDRLVTIPQFRDAYRRRAPKMGHALGCGCGGTGWVADATGAVTRCPRPIAVLTGADTRALTGGGPGPDRARLAAVVQPLRAMLARNNAALTPEPDRPRLRPPPPLVLPRFDETYFTSDEEGTP